MRTKIILLIVISFFGSLTQSFAETNMSEHEANIQAILVDIYSNISNYESLEYEDIFDGESLGELIRKRMFTIMALLIFITTAFKTLKVLGDPKEDFSKYMFIKPVALILLMIFYTPTMGVVNDILKWATFSSISEKTVVVTQVNHEAALRNSYKSFSTWPAISYYEYDEELIENKKYDHLQVASDEQLLHQYETHQKIVEAEKSGTPLTDEEILEISKEAMDNIEGSKVVKNFQRFTYWSSDKITLVMRIMQTVFLSILLLGGPIAITAETVFQGSLKKWFGIFVHTHLWTPVIFLLDIVAVIVNRTLLEYDNTGATTIVTLVVQIVIIAGYIMIAKISSNFIASQEGGEALAFMSYKTLGHLRAGAQRLGGGSGVLAGLFKGTIGKK